MMHTEETETHLNNNTYVPPGAAAADQQQQQAPPAQQQAQNADGADFGADRIFYLNKPKDLRDGLAAGVGNFLKGKNNGERLRFVLYPLFT